MKLYLVIDVQELDMNQCVRAVYDNLKEAKVKVKELKEEHDDFIIVQKTLNAGY